MNRLSRNLLPAVAVMGCMAAAPVVAHAGTQGQVVLSPRSNGVDARLGGVVMRVTALTDQIVRVRMGPKGTLPENASWAVPAAVRKEAVPVTATADGFTTGDVQVHIGRDLQMKITDRAGHVILADTSPIRFDGSSFTISKALPDGEHIYGMGDKTGGTLDRRSHSYVDWNTDSYGFDSSTDPIYKSIPFFIGTGGAGGSYGVFLDNTRRSWFDFGHKSRKVLTFGAPDGPIDYYVIAGPTTRDVVRRYTDLTGKAPLTPLWALGYQQSRWSYMSAKEVRDIAATLRKDKIPTDVIWLDIDYQDHDRPFTVNKKTFPDMKGLVSDMKKEGIRLVAITDLHVAKLPDQGYKPYDTGMAGNHFVHNPDGSVYVGDVWPGPSVFPDFTDKSARDWWGTNFKQFVADGFAGFWNDMNEPAIFNVPSKTMPLDTVHHIDSDDFKTRNATHAEIHNVFGMENTRATYDGVRKLAPNERAFVMTRASYAGGQRYAATWTGDNSSTWNQLKLAVHQMINLGLSGFSYSGADVGGFTGGSSPDLMTRWFEIAAFSPIFRDHSAKGTPRAEPWVDGPKQLDIRRKYVNERYRLMPYIYAVADNNARTGDPLMRPVFYNYPQLQDATCDQSMAFTLGSALMIAPPPKPESPETYNVCLPAGGWYDLWTGKPVTPVQPVKDKAKIDTIEETPRLDHLPVYVRAGTILPTQPLVQSTADTPSGPLTLNVYPGEDCHGTLYLDDGHSMAFKQGHYLRQQIRCRMTSTGSVELMFGKREGDYQPWWNQIRVVVHGSARPLEKIIPDIAEQQTVKIS
ncbi:alpha-glucosidase [Stakelama sediminis]|uniref:Alpha-glucosidase n=1 Tax=Stakelama sediminis TaxID=463200 RepID=A0A840YY22_9SPHN|nr:TIM-barrel domain-containing protein [Stakelama sediminis]MBB5718661.1 alpha-glucosidase [Stakelama sediminis]